MKPKKNPEIDIGRNSSLYFAMGLNIMLFFTWRTLEYKTYDTFKVSGDIVSMEEQVEEEIPIIQLNTPPPSPPPPAVLTETAQIVDDMIDIEETVIESTETNQLEKIEEYVVSISDVGTAEVEEDVEVPFAVIEDAPIFPGCEHFNKLDRKTCFQAKIQEHIKENFNYPQTAIEMGIYGRVFVIFVIDVDGSITKIQTRGPDAMLEEEARRIISSLPKMIPGKQRGKPVKVPFSLPINFVMVAN